MIKFYSNGKLLLTGEYLVLDGAKSFALPTKFGQDLIVEKIKESQIFIFDSAGHIPFVNYQRKCFELIEEFLGTG